MSSSRILKKVKYAMRFLPDELYIQIYYFARFKKFCNLKKPSTFNEKINWLKLHDRNPLYTSLVDKFEVKNKVAEIIGDQYIIPTLGVWDSFDQIDFDRLPEKFVLKCTHDSEGIVIVQDKNKLDKTAAREKIEGALKQNFYYIGREWPYKNVRPRIIAEQYMEDHIDGELRDYKFLCFNGEPRVMYVASDRSMDATKFDFYDMAFNHLDIMQHYPNAQTPRRKPAGFEQMILLAQKLSTGFCHVRVDFYEVDGHLFFGELTFYHISGFCPFKPEKWDRIFGEWLELPNKEK